MVFGLFGGKKKKEDAAVAGDLGGGDGGRSPIAEPVVVRPHSELMPDLTGLENLRAAAPRYNPYEGLPSTLDPGLVEKLYNMPEQPEFLFAEERGVQHRSWTENITYCTGIGAFAGAIAGVASGAFTASKSGPAPGIADTSKLRANRMLNAASNRGTLYGNNMGVVGFLYGGLEGFCCYLRGTDDVLNSVMAGTATGCLYKVSGGPRAMLVYGSAMGTAFGAASAVSYLSKGRPLISL